MYLECNSPPRLQSVFSDTPGSSARLRWSGGWRVFLRGRANSSCSVAYSTRVTFASLLLRAGVDIRTAKDLMRHSTIAMTGDLYACTMRGSQTDAVERLPDLSKPLQERAQATGTADADPDLALGLA